MAVLREEVFGMSFLKISTPDFRARNLRGDSQNGDAALEVAGPETCT